MRRTGPGSVRLLVRVWEIQTRGVLHVHPVLGYGSAAEMAGARAYLDRLSKLAPQYGFGFVDHDRRRVKAHPATGAAAYLSSYFVNGTRPQGGAVGIGDVRRDAGVDHPRLEPADASRRGARCETYGFVARCMSCGVRGSRSTRCTSRPSSWRCSVAASSSCRCATLDGLRRQFQPRLGVRSRRREQAGLSDREGACSARSRSASRTSHRSRRPSRPAPESATQLCSKPRTPRGTSTQWGQQRDRYEWFVEPTTDGEAFELWRRPRRQLAR